MPLNMVARISRLTWAKQARAVFRERSKNREGMNTGYAFAVRLYGPSDGSGCMPAGETITKDTRWRSSKQKAIAEAIAYCDERKIKIKEFPTGYGY